jgi:hypothetical protein
MSNANLPYTDFPEHRGRRAIPRVPALGDEPPSVAMPAADRLPADGRLVRVRAMTRPAAEAHAQAWCREGARPLEAPAPWHAWERRRTDVLTGGPRVQRLAVGPGDPATVVNWSTPGAVTGADDDHWDRVLAHNAGAVRAALPAPGGHAWEA